MWVGCIPGPLYIAERNGTHRSLPLKKKQTYLVLGPCILLLSTFLFSLVPALVVLHTDPGTRTSGFES